MLIELSNSGGRIVEAEAQAGAQFDQNRSTLVASFGSLIAVK